MRVLSASPAGLTSSSRHHMHSSTSTASHASPFLSSPLLLHSSSEMRSSRLQCCETFHLAPAHINVLAAGFLAPWLEEGILLPGLPVCTAEPQLIPHRHMQAVGSEADVHILWEDPEGQVDLHDSIPLGFCMQQGMSQSCVGQVLDI